MACVECSTEYMHEWTSVIWGCIYKLPDMLCYNLIFFFCMFKVVCRNLDLILWFILSYTVFYVNCSAELWETLEQWTGLEKLLVSSFYNPYNQVEKALHVPSKKHYIKTIVKSGDSANIFVPHCCVSFLDRILWFLYTSVFFFSFDNVLNKEKKWGYKLGTHPSISQFLMDNILKGEV